MRISEVIAPALVLLVVVTGCSDPALPEACPAIAYSTVIPVEVSGPRAGSVTSVQVCSNRNECSDGSPVAAPHQMTETPEPAAPNTEPAPMTSRTNPSGPYSSFTTTRLSEENWEIETGMVLPEKVIVQALDTQRLILAEVKETLEWTRINGTEECSGNARSNPIRLITT